MNTSSRHHTRLTITIIVLFLLLGSGVLGQSGTEDYRFRPENEYQALGKKTPYQEFLETENIPIYTGWATDLYEIDLVPWKRHGPGIEGAYVVPDGTGGLVDLFVMEIPVNGKTQPEHHLFEEQIMILSGEGEAHFWQKDPAKKTVVRFKKGTVFSPPLNTWHQFVNAGSEPVRLVAETDLPLKLDLFHNQAFIFHNDFQFTDRYAGQPDYFDLENSKNYAPGIGHHSLSIVNVVRDAWRLRLFLAGQGYGDIDRHVVLSGNVMPTHIEQLPIGTYERAHAHGPGSAILLLDGNGYTLLWHDSSGRTPWKDGKGDQVIKVDYKEGRLFVPPTRWFHQHFAIGKTAPRFIRLGSRPGNEVHKITAADLFLTEHDYIYFHEQDPYILELFKKELAQKGGTLQMPPIDKLIALEKAAGENLFLQDLDAKELQRLYEAK